MGFLLNQAAETFRAPAWVPAEWCGSSGSKYDPIILPDGPKLLTLRDAAEYITALPKADHVLPNAAESARPGVK